MHFFVELVEIHKNHLGRLVNSSRFVKFSIAVGILFGLEAPRVEAEAIPMKELAFTEYMSQAVQREVGEIPVSVKGPLTLSVGTSQVNLDRVFAFCQKNESACALESERYIKGVSQVIKTQNAPIEKSSIRLVVRSSEYIKSAQASLGENAPVIQIRPLVNGLVAVAVQDTPRAIRPLNDRDLKKLEVSQEQLFELGAQNLRGALKPLTETAKPVSSGQIGTMPLSFDEVGRVVLHDDWAVLAKSQNDILLVTLPTTDTVLYISEATPRAIDALRTLARKIAGKSPNPLSPAIIRWTQEKWEVVP